MLDKTAIERLRRLGGDAFLAEMIDLFLENAPRRIEAAREADARRDFAGVRRAVHSLKSTAGNVGARRVQALAEQIEETAGDGDSDRVAPLLEELEAEWLNVRKELGQERPESA